jgi:hypothetical protein
MKLRLLILVCFALCAMTSHAQSKKQKAKIDSISRAIDLKAKSAIDSVNKVLEISSNEQVRKTDSLTHSLYVSVLERTSNIQNNRDTYYSFIIAALTLLITGLAVLFGFNWYSNNDVHKKEMATLTGHYNQAKQDQEATFKALFEKTRSDFESDRKALLEIKKLVEEKTFVVTESNEGDAPVKTPEPTNQFQVIENIISQMFSKYRNESANTSNVSELNKELTKLKQENIELTKETLDAITGGDSYGYIRSGLDGGMNEIMNQPSMWIIRVQGTHPIFDVRAEMVRVTPTTNGYGYNIVLSKTFGTIIPTVNGETFGLFNHTLFGDQLEIGIRITARNGVINQNILLIKRDDKWLKAEKVERITPHPAGGFKVQKLAETVHPDFPKEKINFHFHFH